MWRLLDLNVAETELWADRITFLVREILFYVFSCSLRIFTTSFSRHFPFSPDVSKCCWGGWMVTLGQGNGKKKIYIYIPKVTQKLSQKRQNLPLHRINIQAAWKPTGSMVRKRKGLNGETKKQGNAIYKPIAIWTSMYLRYKSIHMGLYKSQQK